MTLAATHRHIDIHAAVEQQREGAPVWVRQRLVDHHQVQRGVPCGVGRGGGGGSEGERGVLGEGGEMWGIGEVRTGKIGVRGREAEGGDVPT